MARSRRRSSAKTARKDWVYRPNLFAIAAPYNAIDAAGTYDIAVRGLTTGFATAQCLWLLDSANRRKTAPMMLSTAGGGIMAGSAMPEGKRTRVHAVEGMIYVEPSTWAVGNLMALGLRIGAYEQDPTSGLASVDADYTMWSAAINATKTSYYANDRGYNQWETRAFKSFGDNGSIMIVRIRARLKYSLNAGYGLGLWVEGESTGVNVRYQTWLRTLVSADG